MSTDPHAPLLGPVALLTKLVDDGSSFLVKVLTLKKEIARYESLLKKHQENLAKEQRQTIKKSVDQVHL